MLHGYSDKMLSPGAVKAVGPPPPDAPHGRCPQCGARGPIVTDARRGLHRVVVAGCRCPYPPLPIPDGHR